MLQVWVKPCRHESWHIEGLSDIRSLTLNACLSDPLAGLSLSRSGTRQEWRDFLKGHNLEASMSRRGNCYDNAVAERFFASLKTERIRRKIYKTR